MTRRCLARHPLHPRQVRCEEPRGHAGPHFNSFFSRRWTDDTAGQAIVEFALLMPLVLLLAAAAIDGARLAIQKADQDRRTATVADWAAQHPGDASWHAIANDQLPGCDVTLDDAGRPGIVHVGSTCQFSPLALHGLWAGLPISAEAASASPASPETSPDPSASPTGSSTPPPGP